MQKPRAMIIYNLFPLLAGKFTQWGPHLARAAEMGFNWVFVNPIQRTGFSGSLYSLADYTALNPLFVDETVRKKPEKQLAEALKGARGLGLSVMVDLVINHCAIDSKLLTLHPEWFEWQEPGKVVHPFADENGTKVVWGDLAKFNFNTPDQAGLLAFFQGVINYLIKLGFKGFRCDAAYQVPSGFWQRLIAATKKAHRDVHFFAETLGCGPDQTVQTCKAGFDFIFNSSKWWDFQGEWLLQQYNATRTAVPSISFAESHDTQRLAEELGNNIAGLKQRYLFSALFSAAVMMPIGFEFGFRKRLHVVHTRSRDWEHTGIDLSSFIAKVNRLKSGHSLLQQDAQTEFLGCDNPNILLMRKSEGAEKLLLILNKDITSAQHFHVRDLGQLIKPEAVPLRDLSPEYTLDFIPMDFSYDLRPGQGIVLYEGKAALKGRTRLKAA
jgi:starch synthase (maltosyl-transferring)